MMEDLGYINPNLLYLRALLEREQTDAGDA
jgi:hypothetical protein